MKRQPPECCQMIWPRRDWYPTYINSSYNSTLKKQNNSSQKQAEEVNGHFSEEKMHRAKCIQRGPPLLTIREMQIKTTMRYHFTSVRTPIIKKNTDNKCWQGYGEIGTLVHCWWECKLVEPLWKTVGRFLKTNKQTNNNKKPQKYHMTQQFHPWVYIWKK